MDGSNSREMNPDRQPSLAARTEHAEEDQATWQRSSTSLLRAAVDGPLLPEQSPDVWQDWDGQRVQEWLAEGSRITLQPRNGWRVRDWGQLDDGFRVRQRPPDWWQVRERLGDRSSVLWRSSDEWRVQDQLGDCRQAPDRWRVQEQDSELLGDGSREGRRSPGGWQVREWDHEWLGDGSRDCRQPSDGWWVRGRDSGQLGDGSCDCRRLTGQGTGPWMARQRVPWLKTGPWTGPWTARQQIPWLQTASGQLTGPGRDLEQLGYGSRDCRRLPDS